MSHELDFSTGKAAIAYAGETPWHRHGQAKPVDVDWTLDQWIDAARVGYEVIRVPALAQRPDGSQVEMGTYFNMRSDTQAILGGQTHTDRRVEVQPREIFHFVHDFVSTDDRFQMEVMGAIRGGAQVWATARFNGALDVAGEAHQAFLLARTGFDGSLATHFQMTVIRAVCNNTLSAAFSDKRALITLRHTSKFDAKLAAEQLAKMAQSVGTFKAAGDALAQHVMAREEIGAFFRNVLDIPEAAKDNPELVSTRKQNQFSELVAAYRKSVSEGAAQGSGWAALQAVTRYVDHARSTRKDDGMSEGEARFVSAQFGSGDALKGKAMSLLLPRVKDLIAA